jgi:hypothetical protein
MTPIATVIIPIGEYHRDIAQRAMDSAKRQTIQCLVLPVISANTPAHGRNMAEDVETPFVVWLDADDWLESNFVEECLNVYEQGKYVYTGYIMGHRHVTPPARNPFGDGSNHLVTTLYPTGAFRYVGGFDETLPGNEDLDFYLRSQSAGVCGVLCPKPLLHYTADGQRSEVYHRRADQNQIKRMIIERNGGYDMGCCGMPGTPQAPDSGEQQPGDILAEALWMGIRKEPGHATGRVYRSGNHARLWVSPADAAAMPHLFRVVQDARSFTPDRAQVLKQSGLID